MRMPGIRSLLVAALTVVTACSGEHRNTQTPAAAAAPTTPTSVVSSTGTPVPGATGTPLALPTPQPIATADDAVWRAIAADTEANLRPLLRPPVLPDGLATVLDMRLPNKPTPGLFGVEYRGPEELLVIAAGPLNPPPPAVTGHQERVLLRGREAVLNVQDDANPTSASWVWWNESGMWKPEGALSAGPSVLYYVRVEGMTPEELLALVEGLRPWTPE